MGEVVNIAEMANIVATTIFDELNWKQCGALDENWPCEKPEHRKSTHPTDIVFKYRDAYDGENSYFQFDLKSYKAGSITTHSLRPYIVSLSQQVACASISEVWQRRYVDDRDSAVVHGVMFVYNHDGEYDKDFHSILKSTRCNTLVHPRGSRIFVLGPADVFWGQNIATQMKLIRGLKSFSGDKLRFHLPQLSRKTLRTYREDVALPIESLLSTHVTVMYRDARTSIDHFIVFYRGDCTSSEEFVFLFNYLFQYQVIDGNNVIEVVGLGVPDDAISYFNKAKSYLVNYLCERDGSDDSGLAAIIHDVSFRSASALLTSFSSEEIGFNRARKD